MKKLNLLHIVSYAVLVIGVFMAFSIPLGTGNVIGYTLFSFTITKNQLLLMFTSAGWTGTKLVFSIAFVVALAIYLFLAISLLVVSLKSKRKKYLWELLFLTLLFAVGFYMYLGFTSAPRAITTAIINTFTNFNVNGAVTPEAGKNLICGLLYVICIISYAVLEFVIYFLMLAKAGSTKIEEENLVMNEGEVRRIIREELLAFFDENSVEISHEETLVKEEIPAEEESTIEETADEPVVEEHVEDELIVEEPIVEPVLEEEPIVEPVLEEEPIVEQVIEEEQIVEPVLDEEEEVEEVDQIVIDEGDDSDIDIHRQVAAMHLRPEDLNGDGRISFVERILSAEDDILDIYDQLKNELLAYGVRSRISSTGDSFRLHRINYCKITISGKKIKLYLNLDPKDYLTSTIPFGDASNKKVYKETPFVFKVKSSLSIRRAKELIADMMQKHGLEKISLVGNQKYSSELIEELKAIKEGK